MNKFLLPLCLACVATPALAQAPTPLDGEWRGRSDGGQCNAPLEYALSIETGVPDRDNHLRSGDFLEAEKYPELTFANARVVAQKGTKFAVLGDLTIKGVTREVELKVELDGVVTDPFGNEKLAVSASTEINREDFGMTWNAALETGGVLVSQKVVIEIEAQAVRQA